eukprot:CAMPEP_0183319488 /NCGR_PEP_ID=MMETSP0160_2-20130417/63810_1 /TAXON_ID=2839 ORGANISM="Odontella Sinensis, Strain Grunow 1884" /NCGR_SAMPLE_ID=MMETSP0160_2 /ASSEMBLY_ACC=CAM_ASM_000250 /LENGTH=370 /DNA_ID=CAMNT_0025485975 /DNA_START=147 /DNA_END=1259 /DNA_ORIENTATION=-
MILRSALFLLSVLPVLSSAFTASTPPRSAMATVRQQQRHHQRRWPSSSSHTALNSSNGNGNGNDREESILTEAASTKSKDGIDSAMRTKLLSESIAPWRTVRLFLYASLGSGAFIGGLVTLSGVAAALSGVKGEVDMNTEYLNLAIDFGAAATFAFLFKYDVDKGSELNTNVEAKLERKRRDKKLSEAMKARERTLQDLNLSVRVSADGKQTKEASVSALQTGAKQHLIVVAGGRQAIRDALLGANLMQMDFALRDVLVVPYEYGVSAAERQSRPSGGFGERPQWETANYVAECVGDGWEEYIESEMADAVEQNGEKVKEDGIAIVVKNTGSIIRRGVGKVPWRDMVNELEGTKDDGVEMADLRFLSPGS